MPEISNIKIQKRYNWSVIEDTMFFLLIIWIGTSFMHNNLSNERNVLWGIVYNDCISNVLIMSSVYYIARLSFSINYRWSKFLFCFIICVLGVRELVFSILQLIHGNDVLLGSIGNTGLLGGLLSIFICTISITIIHTKNYIWLLLMIPFVALIIITNSRASWLCIIMAFIPFCMKYDTLKKFIISWRLPLLLIVFVLGTFSYLYKKQSADARLFMALMFLMNIFKVGFWGVGPGNYCGFYGQSLFDYFLHIKCDCSESSIECVEKLSQDIINVGIPECSYNEIIRAYTEIGFVGTSLLLAITLISFFRLYNRNDSLAFGFLALIVFSQFSFPGLIPLFCCLFAVFVAAGASISADKKCLSVRPYLFIVPLLFTITFCNLISRREINSDEYLHLEDSYKLGYNYDVSRIGEMLYEKGYASPAFLFMYGNSLAELGEYERSSEVIRHGMEVSADPVFWRMLGNNSKNNGEYSLAEKHYLHSFIMAPNRFQPLLDLADLYYMIGDYDKLSQIYHCSLVLTPKVENDKTRYIKNKVKAYQNVNNE